MCDRLANEHRRCIADALRRLGSEGDGLVELCRIVGAVGRENGRRILIATRRKKTLDRGCGRRFVGCARSSSRRRVHSRRAAVVARTRHRLCVSRALCCILPIVVASRAHRVPLGLGHEYTVGRDLDALGAECRRLRRAGIQKTWLLLR